VLVDDELFELVQNSASQFRLASVLVQTWFPDQEIELQKIYEIDEFQNIQLRGCFKSPFRGDKYH
jgi:putative restriction endonuclease